MTDPTHASQSDPSAPIEWTTVQDETVCPRCEYNLYGLTEPRCPECGLRFTWSELRGVDFNPQSPLFENPRRPRSWTFFATVARSMIPWRFWRNLRLTHPINRRRLFEFYLICAVLIPLTGILPIVSTAFGRQYLNNISVNRMYALRWSTSQPKSGWLKDRVDEAGGIQNYLNQTFPTDFWGNLKQFMRFGVTWRMVVVFLVLPLAWPIVSFFALLIFESSLKKSKPGRWHVFRCVIYPYSAFLVSATCFGALGALELGNVLNFRWLENLAIIPINIALLYPISLAVAAKRYLRINRPITTVLLSQFLVGATYVVVLTSIAMNG